MLSVTSSDSVPRHSGIQRLDARSSVSTRPSRSAAPMSAVAKVLETE